MTLPFENVSNPWTQVKPILWLCSPTLFGFVIFLFSFPLNRPLPFTRLTIFDALFLWSWVAPLFTIAAIVMMFRQPFRQWTSMRWRVGAWLGVALVACLNLLLVAGFMAAAYD